MILGPTYSEYEREITLGGGTTNYYPLRESDGFRLDADDFCCHLNDSIDLLVLCNPNNPTSTSINRDEMRLILDTCLQYGIFVMVDETYVEFAPKEARVTAVPLTNYYNNLIILRGHPNFSRHPDCASATPSQAIRTSAKQSIPERIPGPSTRWLRSPDV